MIVHVCVSISRHVIFPRNILVRSPSSGVQASADPQFLIAVRRMVLSHDVFMKMATIKKRAHPCTPLIFWNQF